jgi:hypothetical protein
MLQGPGVSLWRDGPRRQAPGVEPRRSGFATGLA